MTERIRRVTAFLIATMIFSMAATSIDPSTSFLELWEGSISNSKEPYPVADFTTSGYLVGPRQWTVVAGFPVQFNFTGEPGDEPCSFQWDFGDGSLNSTEQDPVHVFAVWGLNYTVTLTVQDADNETDTITGTIICERDYSMSAGAASAQCNATSILEGDHVAFNASTNQGNPPYQYYWDFGDGTNSTLKEPVHQYTTAGVYVANVTITDVDGDQDTSLNLVISVEVDLIPQANFTTNDTHILEGEWVSFTFTGDPGNQPTTYYWDFGDGTNFTADSMATLVHQYLVAGTYTVVLVVQDNDGDVDSITLEDHVTVEVDVEPVADFICNATPGMSPGVEVQFNFTGNPGNEPTSYSWDFGDGTPVSTLRDPVHQFVAEGTYSLSLTVTDNDGDQDYLYELAFIQVGDDLTPIALFEVNETLLIENEQVEFTFTGFPGNESATYFWDFGDGSNDTSMAPVHQYTTAGVYDVSLTVTDADGDSDTIVQHGLVTVEVDLPPNASFTSNTTVLENPGEWVAFTFIGDVSNAPLTFLWDFGDGTTSTEENPVHRYDTVQDYTVCLTVTDRDGDASISTRLNYIQQERLPFADFVVNATNVTTEDMLQFNFTGLAGNTPATYLWDFGNGDLSTDKDPLYSYPANGTYTVSLTVVDVDGDSHQKTILGLVQVGDDKFPVPWFTANESSVISGEEVQLNFTGLEGDEPAMYTWEWRYTSAPADTYAQFSTDRDPVFSTPNALSMATNLTFRLNVTDFDGDQASIEQEDLVLVMPDLPLLADFSTNTTTLIAGQEAQFTFTGNEGNGIAVYQWDFGDGTQNSTERDPIHRFATPGVYNITLTIQDLDGDADTVRAIDLITVLVDVAPVANFTLNASTIIEGQVIQFNQTCDPGNGIAAFLWDLGDGTISTKVNLTHQYTKPGSYNVSLTVVDIDGDQDTMVKENAVVVLEDIFPVASFSINISEPVDANSSILFNYTGTEGNGILSITWQFGDGTPVVTGPSVVHEFVSDGYYTVNVSVIDVDGDIDAWHEVIQVGAQAAPVADFISNTTSILEGEHVQFIFTGVLGEAPNIFNWNFGDGGTSTEQNPVHRYDFPGSFDVTLEVIDGTGDSSVKINTGHITVFDDTAPTADFVVNATRINQGAAVQFNFTGEEGNGNLSFQWNFGDGKPNSTLRDPVRNFTEPGLYTITLTVIDGDGDGATSQAVNLIEVGTGLVPFASFTVNSTTIILGEAVQFTFTGDEGDAPATFLWTFGDGTNSTERDPVHVYTMPGTYDVSLLVNDSNGDDQLLLAWATISVIEDLVPLANFSVNASRIYEGCSVLFTFTGIAGNTPTLFAWDFGDGTIANTVDVVHVFPGPGTFTVQLSIIDGNGDQDSCMMNLEVVENLIPEPNFTVNVSTIKTGELARFTFSGTCGDEPCVFTWDFGDGTFSHDRNPEHAYERPGIYNVTLTITDASGDVKNFTLEAAVTVVEGNTTQPSIFGMEWWNIGAILVAVAGTVLIVAFSRYGAKNKNSWKKGASSPEKKGVSGPPGRRKGMGIGTGKGVNKDKIMGNAKPTLDFPPPSGQGSGHGNEFPDEGNITPGDPDD